jgi:hypothetical protein
MRLIPTTLAAALITVFTPAIAAAHGSGYHRHHRHATHHARHHHAIVHKADVAEGGLATTCTVPEPGEPLACLEDTPTVEEQQALDEAVTEDLASER